MILRAVLARIAKRDRALKCRSVCPGWRVVDTSDGRRARVVACAECNALCRAGLRVTDADVRQIPAARDARDTREAEIGSCLSVLRSPARARRALRRRPHA